MNQTPVERIKQRRSQMMVHSYLYYHLDSPIISDDRWQQFANELVDLQRKHGCVIGWYDADFVEWAGATGCHLPRDERVRSIAQRLLNYINIPGRG